MTAQRLPPEILLDILQYLDKPSHARCARVCRSWSEPALELVWHTPDDWVLPLMSIVGTRRIDNNLKVLVVFLESTLL